MNRNSWIQIGIAGVFNSLAAWSWIGHAWLWLCIVATTFAVSSLAQCLSMPTNSSPAGSFSQLERAGRVSDFMVGLISFGVAYGVLYAVMSIVIDPIVLGKDLEWWRQILFWPCLLLLLVFGMMAGRFIATSLAGSRTPKSE